MARHDPILAPLLDARDASERQCALEILIVEHVLPIVGRVLSRYHSRALPKDDVDDLAATINLRVIRRLQEIEEDDPILRFDDYVATVAYNVVYAFLRRRYPERTRLKNRLRYLFTHDDRLAIWEAGRDVVCGRATWRGRALGAVAMASGDATAVMRDQESPAKALLAMLDRANGPLPFDDVVRLAAEVWKIADVPARPAGEEARSETRNPALDIETRQYVQALWREVLQLREPQRAALLMNLRDVEGTNGLSLLLVSGTASFDEIAAAMSVAPERLSEMWNDLPFDDNTIARMLNLSRQQVINLRKAARERLSRKMVTFDRGGHK